MEKWAERIHERMIDAGKLAADLARACGIKPGSVSGWFGQGKPTKMISGDNLVMVAQYLGTTAEYVMTGRGAVVGPSHSARPDFEKLASAVYVVREYLELFGEPAEFLADPTMLETAYEVVDAFGQPVERSNVIDLVKTLKRKMQEGTGGQESFSGTSSTFGS